MEQSAPQNAQPRVELNAPRPSRETARGTRLLSAMYLARSRRNLCRRRALHLASSASLLDHLGLLERVQEVLQATTIVVGRVKNHPRALINELAVGNRVAEL